MANTKNDNSSKFDNGVKDLNAGVSTLNEGTNTLASNYTKFNIVGDQVSNHKSFLRYYMQREEYPVIYQQRRKHYVQEVFMLSASRCVGACIRRGTTYFAS